MLIFNKIVINRTEKSPLLYCVTLVNGYTFRYVKHRYVSKEIQCFELLKIFRAEPTPRMQLTFYLLREKLSIPTIGTREKCL